MWHHIPVDNISFELNRTIFTNGCFDVLHRGHVELLKFCKSLGNVVVGINSDSSVTKLKGANRPINNQLDRKYILESIRYVDKVLIFDELTPLELIIQLQPSIIVKGGDYKVDDVVGNDISEGRIFPFVEGYSSTSLIKGITERID